MLLFANTAIAADQDPSCALPSRISLWGTTGNNTFGVGDAMIPFLSNSDQSFYTDVTAKYGRNNSWVGSIGLGDRAIALDDTILGAYLFGDYNKTANANYFPVINPGVEFMTNQWDGHLNGYFPTGDETKLVSSTTGMPNTYFFTGHALYAPTYSINENVGPGADLEIGNTSFYLNRTRFFMGGYAFAPKNSTRIHGVEGGFELPVYHQRIFADVRDSFDNVYRNTFTVSLRFTFGGLDKTGCPDIHDRMLDLIPRHLGTLNVGDGIPSQTQAIVGRKVIISNIWFFIPGVNSSDITLIHGFQDATYENPAHGLAQTQFASINAISPNAIMYFNSGTYNNPLVGTGYSLFAGQNIYGRMNYFANPAVGGARPILNDSFILNGNNNVSDVQIIGNTVNTANGVMAQTGVLIPQTATGTVNINDTAISVNASGSTANTNTATGLLNNSSGIVNFSNSSVAVNSSFTGVNTIFPNSSTNGITNAGSGTINTTNSSVTVNAASDAGNNTSNQVNGVLNSASGTINVTSSSVTTNLINGLLSSGISNITGGTINISNSTISSFGTNILANVTGVSNDVTGGGNAGNTNINQSTINVNGNNSSATYGVQNANGTTNITNSALNVTANSNLAIGLFNSGPPGSSIIFGNTIVNLFTSGGAIAITTSGPPFVINSGGSSCFVNGVATGPC